MSQPMLSGIKIIDLTSVVFGPYATRVLADLGADVVKVESPEGGDMMRWLGKSNATPGMGPSYLGLNRGKRAIALDLKADADKAVMHQLLADADVFVVNVRGKAMERLGLDYASVAALNPDIIYVHCVGFGQHGPYADLPAYDDVIQAASGATSLLSRVDGNPKARYFPSLIADKVSGLHAVYAMLAAVIHKLRTGRGQHVEVPMFEAFTNFLLVEHLGGLTFDPPNDDVGYLRQIDPNRQPYPTKDGNVSVVGYTDPQMQQLFTLLGKPEIVEEPQFATPELRRANISLLYAETAKLTPNFTSAELLGFCHAAGIPAQGAPDIADIMADAHLAATGFFTPRDHPSEGKYFEMQQPVKFSDADLPLGAPAPLRDQHGAAIRAELGTGDHHE